MSRAASNFLQGANAANAASGAMGGNPPAAGLDDSDILSAVGRAEVVDVASLANQLGMAVGAVTPMVEKLSRKGLIGLDQSHLKLTAAGERALRYIDLASF